MNNIIIDSEKVEIKEISINKSSNWKYSIEISFDFKKEIDYLDIFFILKSYCWNSIIPCYSIAFAKKDSEEKLMTFEKESIEKIKKINFINFKEWLDWRISNDKKYNSKSTFYYILLSFEKTICDELNLDLNKLKPIYPWSPKWMEFLKIDEYKIEYLENLLKYKDKKIKDLEKEIENLKKK